MSDTQSNPWFGFSMALVGVIIGYGTAMATGVVGSPPSQPTQVAEVPSPTPSPAPTPAPAPSAKDVPPVDPEVDHIRGDANAEIAVIEYSDFECPFCQRHHPTMVQLLENNDDIMWVYRHFPLSFHPNAMPSAVASECVAELGGNDAFWEFSDIIFERGAVISRLEEYATEVGVDASAFSDCMDSGKYDAFISTQMADGSSAGVTGTPGNIVLNIETGESRIVSGAQPLANLQAAVDALR